MKGIATLDGDIITSGGRMTGGYYSKGKDEFLERRKELKKILFWNWKDKLRKQKNRPQKGADWKRNKERGRNRNRNLIMFWKINNGYNEFIKKYDSFNLDYNKIKKEEDVLNFEINEKRRIYKI